MSLPDRKPRPPYDAAMEPIIHVSPPGGDDVPDLQAAADAIREQIRVQFGHVVAEMRADTRLAFTDGVIPGPGGEIPYIKVERAHTNQGAASSNLRPGINYRLAPEHTDMAANEDCYAGLLWVEQHFKELGLDPDRLILAGQSAGSGLAAGTALMARDKGGPKLRGLHLKCPTIDDRCNTISYRQYWDSGSVTGQEIAFFWKCALGDRAGADDVSPYVAPARATDLSGLPETFIDVGSADPHRDESVAFASKLWECGTQAELHVVAGGPHSFGYLMPDADISKFELQVEMDWMTRVLERQDQHPAV